MKCRPPQNRPDETRRSIGDFFSFWESEITMMRFMPSSHTKG